MSDAIFAASSASDYAAFAGLVREYVDWCRGRYRELPELVDLAFSHQSLDSELATLSTAYGPPRGRAFLARRDEDIVGCGAYRKLSDGICEMKRLFVPDRFRGGGTGRTLCHALIAEARADGFTVMRLDTASRFIEAIALYESVGFRRRSPYNEYPEILMPHLIFMELPLTSDA